MFQFTIWVQGCASRTSFVRVRGGGAKLRPVSVPEIRYHARAALWQPPTKYYLEIIWNRSPPDLVIMYISSVAHGT